MTNSDGNDKRGADNNQENIRNLLATISNIDVNDITDDVLIREELGVDSLKGMEIVLKIEKQFNIDIDETQIIEINTVGDFIALIRQKLEHR